MPRFALSRRARQRGRERAGGGAAPAGPHGERAHRVRTSWRRPRGRASGKGWGSDTRGFRAPHRRPVPSPLGGSRSPGRVAARRGVAPYPSTPPRQFTGRFRLRIRRRRSRKRPTRYGPTPRFRPRGHPRARGYGPIRGAGFGRNPPRRRRSRPAAWKPQPLADRPRLAGRCHCRTAGFVILMGDAIFRVTIRARLRRAVW